MEYMVIGDLVRSRRAADRSGVQDAVAAALARVEASVPSVDGLHPTVGDEFQGVYPSLAAALRVSLLARLELLDVIDTRYGIGAGDRVVLDDTRTPPLQDGSGWWSAREAIDALGASRTRRTWFLAAGEPEPPAAVNALLLCRDALVDRIGPSARPMLLRALQGASQRQIAAEEGVSASAVSQQFARGVGAVRDAHNLLETATRTADDGAVSRP